jgi:glycerophosphoryl diester phosphodiesterase
VHRDASDIFFEEALNAFNKAIRVKDGCIGLDMKEIKDHPLIAMHDSTVDGTTKGKGKVRSFSLEELKQLDAGYPTYHKKTSITIATVDEIFEKYKIKTNYMSRSKTP